VVLNMFRVGIIIILSFVSAVNADDHVTSGDKPVIEILKWKSKAGVSDERMVESVNNMVVDLKSLDGFLHQSLYKSSDGVWIDVYYWNSKEDADLSSVRMSDKKSYKELVDLIELESIKIDVMEEIQSSESLIFE
jgi:hypothetical protein